MKNILTAIGQQTRAFQRHWLSYFSLFVSVDLVIQLIVIPLFRLATTVILQAAEIPFISYQNVVIIARHHPLVVVALLVELICLLLVVDLQFAAVLLGIRDISREMFTVRGLVREIWQTVRRLRPSSLLVLMVYFILVIPFADLVYRTPLLTKIQVPQFILDYLTRNGLLLTATVMIYLVLTFLGLRLVWALPLMVYQRLRPRAAFRQSWQQTQGRRWLVVALRLLMIGFLAVLVMAAFYALVIGAQWLLDFLPQPVAALFANINLLIIQLGSELVTTWTGVVTVSLLFLPLTTAAPVTASPRLAVKGKRVFAGLTLVVLVVVAAAGNGLYLSTSQHHRPVTISQRGVAEENGVQNTLPALKRTHRLHPDYVELDVHETKDRQFVVLHDENLKELAGVNKTPRQLTLKQLTRLTVHENGHQAKLASFTTYLRTADRLHQKLLVEIKPTPADSPGMVKRFVDRYGTDLIQHHALVHSLDYGVVEQLKRLEPRLPVMYIQPYNFTYPNTAANGYSMEYSTLTYDFITLAHLQGKRVYAWTVNEPAVMMQMMYKNADGIITDNLAELNRQIATYEDQRSYARQLLNYILVVPTNTEFAP